MDKYIKCPRCSSLFNKRLMRKINHPSGAVLDVCDNCGGMWLDKDEVKLLYSFSKKGKVRK
ncbi:zf-TFIIB domain-containing protein [Candidatus Woesearchaeota archaeon]|nr:zf-TFIIB domain-containing protein [Candidatus Woesearchaeota archaeon]